MNTRTTTELVERDLRRHSVEGTAIGVDGAVQPRAAVALQEAWVMFSYAWLNQGSVGKQLHTIQKAFFTELERQLKYPPAQFASLPPLRLWRDERRLHMSEPAGEQIEDICRNAFLCVIMMSDKYPHSPACMQEAKHFIDDEGGNHPGKNCIIVPVNVHRTDAPERFSNKLRLWVLDDAERPLRNSWSRAAADKREAIVRKVSDEIFRAAARIFRPSTETKPTRHPIAALASLAALEHRADQTVGPRARRARLGADIATASPGTAEPEGVEIVSHLADWACAPDGPRLTALLGEFGMGKTVTCQLITQELLVRHQAGVRGAPLPLYFDLRHIGPIRDGREPTLEMLIDDMLRRPGETPPAAADVIAYVRQNPAVIIFDGLDEVTNKVSTTQAINIYRQLLAIVPAETWLLDAIKRRASSRIGLPPASSPAPPRGPLIVVACRSHYFRDIADQRSFLGGLDRAGISSDGDIQTFIMLAFSPDQVSEYLQLHLSADEANRADELIRQTYDLGQLAQRPILLRFIREMIGQLEAEKLAGRTINTTRLYDILVNQTLARDDPKHVIPRLEKIGLLQKLAYSMHRGDLPEFTHAALDEWFVEAAEGMPRLAKILGSLEGLTLSEVFLQDIRNASLLVRVGDGAFRFAHTSIREYFLADKIFDAVGSGNMAVLVTRPLSRETIKFMLNRLEICDRAKRDAFRSGFPALLSTGAPSETRLLGLGIWTSSQYSLPRPSTMDLSGLTFTRQIIDVSSFEQEAFGPGQSAEQRSILLPFQKTIWRGTHMSGTAFIRMDLRGADFDGAHLAMSEWVDCAFEETRFHGADLRGSFWYRCNLPADIFAGADIGDSEAASCTLAGEPWHPESICSGAAMHPVSHRSPGEPSTAALFRIGDRDILVTASEEMEIRVVDGSSGRVFAVVRGQGKARSITCQIGSSEVNLTITAAETVEIRSANGEPKLLVLEPISRPGTPRMALTCALNGAQCVFEAQEDGALLRRDGTNPAGQFLTEAGFPIRSLSLGQLAGNPTLVITRDFAEVKLIDPQSAQEVAATGRQGFGCYQIFAFGDCIGRPVVVATALDAVRLIDVIDGSVLNEINLRKMMVDNDAYLRSAALFRVPELEVLVFLDSTGAFRSVDLATRKLLAVGAHERFPWPSAIGRAGNRLIVATESGITDAITGENICRIVPLESPILDLSIGCFGDSAAVAFCNWNYIVLVSTETGEQIARFDHTAKLFRCLCLARLGRGDRILGGGPGGAISFLDPATGMVDQVSQAHNGAISNLRAARIGDRDIIVATTKNNVVIVTDSDATCRHEIIGSYGMIRDVEITQIGPDPVIGVSSGCLELITLNRSTLAPGRRLILGPGEDTLLDLHPDTAGGYRVAHISDDAARHWRAQGLSEGRLLVQSINALPRLNGKAALAK